MTLTDKEALTLMKLYKVKQVDLYTRMNKSKGAVSQTIKYMKEGYPSPRRGASEELKDTLIEILKEKGIEIKTQNND